MDPELQSVQVQPSRSGSRLTMWGFCCACLVVCFVGVWFLNNAPTDYPIGHTITIQKGGASTVAAELKRIHAIHSANLFSIMARVTGRSTSIDAGTYVLDTKETTYQLLKRMAHGDTREEVISLVIPEGLSVVQIADSVHKTIPSFDTKTFITLAKPYEGYLFPDTYLVKEDLTPQALVDRMRATFEKKTAPLRDLFQSFGKSEADVIKMASILEEEARLTDTRKIVAGILWKRIALGMPLQVDSSFLYINGKTSGELTLADLKIKSPYNSYLYKGLPPTPISNPGLDAIQAALTPTKTDYLYFLTDTKGVMHYAKTFEGHVANKLKYLK